MAKGVQEQAEDGSAAENPQQDGRLIVKWIELQPSSSQARHAQDHLDNLLLKAAKPWHNSKNACIELCFFVEQCRSSLSSSIQEVAFSKSTSLDLFNFYIEGDEKGQTRQMRQVLELVASLIARHPKEEIAESIKESLLLRLISIITHQAAQPLVKPAFKALDLVLSKRAISLEEVIKAYEKNISQRYSTHSSSLDVLSSWDHFISDIFDWMALADVSPAAGKCLVTLFGQMKGNTNTYIPDSTFLWQRWIRNGLDKDPAILENVKNYLFPSLFRFDRPGSILFLEDLNGQKSTSDLKNTRDQISHSLLQLVAIEAGKKAGLVEEPNSMEAYKATNRTTKPIELQEDVIGVLITSEVNTVRSLAFSVLVASSSPLRPFTSTTLDILQSHMGILYADTDAKFRTDTLSNTRKLIERFRGATAYLNRELEDLSRIYGPEPSTNSEGCGLYGQIQNILKRHEEFIEWFLEFLLGELIPTVSYQRHITALKATRLLLQSGILDSLAPLKSIAVSNTTSWHYRINFFTSSAMRLLLDLLMDPFEDVRSSAAALLKLAYIEDFANRAANNAEAERGHTSLVNFISRAEDLARRTGRADYGDGVARCYDLLYSLLPSTDSRLKLVRNLVHDLGSKICIGEQNLAKAVSDAPVHGTFAALNLIWETIDLETDFLSLDGRSVITDWKILQAEILSQCSLIWGHVKNVLCNDSPEGHLPQGLDESDIVDTKDVLSYSFRAIHESNNLMRSMATKVKFTWKDGSSIIPFEGALSCIFEQTSTTRRSAGIPILLTSILSANAEEPAFHDVITELVSLAKKQVQLSIKEETSLPQVHAMNCLKEIFKSSALGNKTEPYIAECLQLAADNLTSEVWAIRNCGLLLLRSLIDCFFGTSESKVYTEAGWDGLSIRLSYERYPSLPELLLHLLDTSTNHPDTIRTPNTGAVESVFPTLDIIRRAGPPPTHRDEIFKLVAKHLSSRIWHVREIAARTICTLLLHEGWLSDLIVLIDNLQPSKNHIHGSLLAVKFILERRLELDPLSATDGLTCIISSLTKSKAVEIYKSIHRDILAVYLEVENTIAKVLLSQPPNSGKGDSASVTKDVIAQIFANNAVKEFVGMKKKYLDEFVESTGAETLSNTIVRRAIYSAALLEDESVLQSLFGDIAVLNTDIVLVALDCVSVAWKNKISIKSLYGVSKAYINLLEASRNPEVCARICYELANILDKSFALIKTFEPMDFGDFGTIGIDLNHAICQLGMTLRRNDNPSFSNARIRISGFLFINEHTSYGHNQVPKGEYNSLMNAWGRLLWEAGDSSNDFDTRHAAAEALQSFFNYPNTEQSQYEREHMLYPLLALYDTLNDDDDEIRDLSARTVSTLLQRSFIPLAARVELVNHIKRLHGGNLLFYWSSICRMTGNDLYSSKVGFPLLESAEAQFSRALKNDDSLFVEEEQNLFVDEVRETRLWAKVFEETDLLFFSEANFDSSWGKAYTALSVWVTDGLATMTGLFHGDDGPLGRTSRPAVFAICMRVLIAAKAITLNNQKRPTPGDSSQYPMALLSEDITAALKRFTSLGLRRNIHGSLIFEV
ncbi:hypothetical protein OIDMADRAFT_108260 [Oidiodendron maius Zn]|uniref:DUF2428 domain-containing protein n=1 Tax=Oidiodendron maius (strain Zn) TaxID=913774 RepID=A0A0C3HWM9_OIDMZ|nr:hypothetical protein OIDMADRAFT_108260 [Oidiodendron maius Zn]